MLEVLEADEAYAFIVVCLRVDLASHGCCTLELEEDVTGVPGVLPDFRSAALSK